SGYFRGVLEAFRLSLRSARANTNVPFDILVVDNNSCRAVDRFIRDEQAKGNIQYHLRSDRNLGSVNAAVQGLRAAPGDAVVYADCDVLFREGWLEQLLSVKEAFPEAGIVCGVPVRYATEAQLALARSVFGADPGTRIEQGTFVSDAVLSEWAQSIGLTLEKYKSSQNVPDFDLRLSRGANIAYAGGGHFAYLTTSDVISRSTHPRTDKLVPGKCPGFDAQITDLGLPSISTPEPVFFHLGNCLAEEWVQREYVRLMGRRPPRAACDPAERKSKLSASRRIPRSIRALFNTAD
ncbi:MAG TPA: glycosyltransferase family A protein, partial [Gaiellaceae bacterium]|nr:glycosyltransferase family A protein [Gaiellaceae bacterium]